MAAEASETIAINLVKQIENTSRLLLTSPLSGVKRLQFAPALRVIFEGKYAIYYIASNTEIVIIRVLHSARDAAALAEQGGFIPNK